MPGDDTHCRFCARHEAHVRLVAIFVVSTHPVRKYWACQQCLTDLDDGSARASVR